MSQSLTTRTFASCCEYVSHKPRAHIHGKTGTETLEFWQVAKKSKKKILSKDLTKSFGQKIFKKSWQKKFLRFQKKGWKTFDRFLQLFWLFLWKFFGQIFRSIRIFLEFFATCLYHDGLLLMGVALSQAKTHVWISGLSRLKIQPATTSSDQDLALAISHKKKVMGVCGAVCENPLLSPQIKPPPKKEKKIS